jgi:G3E family GTPase
VARGRKPPIPLTLVVGPTGAGKTTLVNRLLRDPAFAHTAVILNDFGATALEASVVDKAEDDILALASGCVCCSVRGALTDGLERLLRALDNGRIARIGRVVIEAAETAGPAAIVAAIVAHPYLSLRFRIDGIVAVLGSDAANVLATRADIVHQVAIADVVALRGDTGVPIPNPAALVVDAATAAPALFTGHGPFDPETGDLDAWLGSHDPARVVAISGEAAEIESFAIHRAGVFPPGTLDQFLAYIVALQGPRLIRLRAAVALGPSDVMVAESYGTFFLPPLVIEREDAANFGLRFVVAARAFDEKTFTAYLDAFLNHARIDTPDRQALTENPLAVAGFSARRGN